MKMEAKEIEEEEEEECSNNHGTGSRQPTLARLGP